jgi:hypothetical protein
MDIDVMHLPVGEYKKLIAEGQKIAAGAGSYSGDPKLITVAVHPTGLWMFVPGVGVEPDAAEDEGRRERLPGVQTVIERAREKGCRWINFDKDAEADPELPYYDD